MKEKLTQLLREKSEVSIQSVYPLWEEFFFIVRNNEILEVSWDFYYENNIEPGYKYVLKNGQPRGTFEEYDDEEWCIILENAVEERLYPDFNNPTWTKPKCNENEYLLGFGFDLDKLNYYPFAFPNHECAVAVAEQEGQFCASYEFKQVLYQKYDFSFLNDLPGQTIFVVEDGNGEIDSIFHTDCEENY